jgi:hypothetical protein
MPLHDEPDGIEQRREVRLGPLFAVAGMVLLLLALVWTVSTFGGRIGGGFSALVAGVQTWTQTAFTRAEATPTLPAPIAANAGDNAGDSGTAGTPAGPTSAANSSGLVGSVPMTPTATSALILVPTDTPTVTPPAEAPTNTPEAVAQPPTPVPTDTPLPTPTPTDTPLATPIPTDTPTEAPTAPPPIAAPICPDAAHAALTAPGENQVVSGDVAISGRAIHEQFQFYKLEFAPGANAGDGFVYFGGANTPVDGGLLGTFSSGSVGNGAYTLRVTVVDITSNFPPPCQVTVFVQN